MKTNRIEYNYGFLFLMLLLGVCQIACAKEPLMESYVKQSEPDTVLHKDSKYIAVFGDIQYYTSSGYLQYYASSLEWIATHKDNI